MLGFYGERVAPPGSPCECGIDGHSLPDRIPNIRATLSTAMYCAMQRYNQSIHNFASFWKDFRVRQNAVQSLPCDLHEISHSANSQAWDKLLIPTKEMEIATWKVTGSQGLQK